MYRYSALIALQCTPIDCNFTKIVLFDDNFLRSKKISSLLKKLIEFKLLILLFTDKQTVNKANKASEHDPSSLLLTLAS